jgi:hypothetical protein
MHFNFGSSCKQWKSKAGRQLVSTSTLRLRVGRSGDRILGGARYFFLFQNVLAGSEVHPASHSVTTGILPGGRAARVVMLTTHHHLVHAFMTWTEKSFTFLPCTPVQCPVYGVYNQRQLRSIESPCFLGRPFRAAVLRDATEGTLYSHLKPYRWQTLQLQAQLCTVSLSGRQIKQKFGLLEHWREKAGKRKEKLPEHRAELRRNFRKKQ